MNNAEQMIEKLQEAVVDLYDLDYSDEEYQRIRSLLQSVDRDVSNAIKTLEKLKNQGLSAP